VGISFCGMLLAQAHQASNGKWLFLLFLLVLATVYFTGEFLPNFDLENIISTYNGKNDQILSDFEVFFSFKSPDWLNYFVNHQFGYITKSWYWP